MSGGEGSATGVVDVAEALSQRCLRGLGAAAAALAGGEVARVCAAFDDWRAEARRSWPWLPGLCYEALDPLAVRFPSDDGDAVVLGRLLVGAETDADAAGAALEARPTAAPSAGDGGQDAASTLRVRRLEAAVDRFWSELVAAATELHPAVGARDRAAADRVVIRTRRRLEDIAEEIEGLAETVAAALAIAPPPPAPPPDPPPEPPAPPSGTMEVVEAPALTDPTTALDDTGPLDATGPLEPPPAVVPPEPTPRPVPKQARRPIPPPPAERGFQQWAPIAFVAVALLIAVIVLLTVGPAPLP